MKLSDVPSGSSRADPAEVQSLPEPAAEGVPERGPAEADWSRADLEAEVVSLRVGLDSRQINGQATGLLAGSLRISTDQAWTVLTILSSFTNLKAREVARILIDGHNGRLSRNDRAAAATIANLLPQALERAVHAATADSGPDRSTDGEPPAAGATPAP